MTPTFPYRLIAPCASALMIASCAASRPISTAAPPRLALAEFATRPCALTILPPEPTTADLEVGYVERGAQLVACDLARRTAVETLLAERRAQDQADAAPPRRLRVP